jgi:hypothetical protein
MNRFRAINDVSTERVFNVSENVCASITETDIISDSIARRSAYQERLSSHGFKNSVVIYLYRGMKGSKQEVLKITNPPIFLTLFNNAAVILNQLVYKLLRGTKMDTQTET